MSNILEVKNISKNFGGVQAVKNFSLDLEEGTVHGIIGPNGAGKSTIYNLISHIYPIDEGSIVFMGEEIQDLSQVEIARKGISRTFQNTRLFPGLSVLDNVKTGIDYAGNYTVVEALFSLPRYHKEEKRIAGEAMDCLRKLKLDEFADWRPSSLPYGIQRRVEIARAIVSNPKVLMIDEPAAGLNPEEVLGLVDFVRMINEELGITCIVIEHRMDFVMNICKTIHVQNFGETIAFGTPAEIQSNPVVLTAYLGQEE